MPGLLDAKKKQKKNNKSMSTINLPELQTIKIEKKKILANIPRDC